jgi:hypothetical protein
MTMRNVLLAVLVAAVAACGGKQTGDTAEGGGATIDTQATSGDPTDHSGNMIPPEKMDEVQHDLQRKQVVISRCLADAVEAGDVPKSTRGRIVVELVVSTDGHAGNVRVVPATTTIKEDKVQGCVVKHVQEISFPQLPKSYETSYSFAMEAN